MFSCVVFERESPILTRLRLQPYWLILVFLLFIFFFLYSHFFVYHHTPLQTNVVQYLTNWFQLQLTRLWLCNDYSENFIFSVKVWVFLLFDHSYYLSPKNVGFGLISIQKKQIILLQSNEYLMLFQIVVVNFTNDILSSLFYFFWLKFTLRDFLNKTMVNEETPVRKIWLLWWLDWSWDSKYKK